MDVPYSLRHAAVSTWLNAGVPATRVAEWAGHSVDVLLRVYAKCIAGQQDEAKRRIDEATRASDDDGSESPDQPTDDSHGPPEPPRQVASQQPLNFGTYLAQAPARDREEPCTAAHHVVERTSRWPDK